jgi:hypothetical protein
LIDRGGVRDILILGTLPDARRRAEIAERAGLRIVSTSPWLSAQLDALAIPHRSADTYAPLRTWEDIHAAAARRVRRLYRRGGAPVDDAWFDDWSHLLVDEVRQQTYWEHVARRLVANGRPQMMEAQRLPPSSAPAMAVIALTRALAALGCRCTPWPPRRAR